MPDEFKTFPKTKTDALTMLYLQARDVSGKTPEELCAIYADAHRRIDAEFVKITKERGSRKT